MFFFHYLILLLFLFILSQKWASCKFFCTCVMAWRLPFAGLTVLWVCRLLSRWPGLPASQKFFSLWQWPLPRTFSLIRVLKDYENPPIENRFHRCGSFLCVCSILREPEWPLNGRSGSQGPLAGMERELFVGGGFGSPAMLSHFGRKSAGRSSAPPRPCCSDPWSFFHLSLEKCGEFCHNIMEERKMFIWD